MLADLSTYSLRDFLLFDAAIYRDLFGQVNGDHWPLAAIGIALAVALLAVRHRTSIAGLGLFVLLAGAFVSSSMVFFFGPYETINWASVYPGWAFVAEAVLFVLAAVTLVAFGRRAPMRAQLRPGGGWPAIAVVLYALFGHPLAGLAFGRSPAALEWFALAPSPTALAALGILALWPSPWRFPLAVVPVAWLLLDAATLAGLDVTGEASLLLLATVLSAGVLVMPKRKPGAAAPAAGADTAPLPAANPAPDAATGPRGRQGRRGSGPRPTASGLLPTDRVQ
ncbi:DUF6064 family protein [Aurantimonas sp. 22II-16-19i]|uniref:DUF6064 family protein n=1 Tax=Aurantimonas sp. 22II-16-19i TaxID=1317114 RepID=UPI0009F7F63F|nr:DUF6064 family protein [Aurantimonas sp. 22II-16-19i]ORE91132.1 hypothetical protein ATO4_19589 [Aurantimonas sp. 22II-16-19i]